MIWLKLGLGLLIFCGLVALAGCDVDKLNSEFNKAVGIADDQEESKQPPVKPAPPPVPTVSEEHAAQLAAIVDRARNVVASHLPITGVGPELFAQPERYTRWRYEEVADFETRTRIDAADANREKATIRFTATTYCAKQEFQSPSEALNARMDDASFVELFFRVEFVHDATGWKFDNGAWGRRTGNKERPLVPETSHHDLCKWMFGDHFRL